jgi:hypothetical protein
MASWAVERLPRPDDGREQDAVRGAAPEPAFSDAQGVLALQRSAGNAAVARLMQADRPALQRYKVDPQPRVEHQWGRRGKLVDLNCGWYAQLGVIDYHYLKSIRPKLNESQRLALEQGGHLSYKVGKAKLPHSVRFGFSPAGYNEYGNRYKNENLPAAAISRTLPKPNTPAQWKHALQTYGPLIVSKAMHYVLVVGVTDHSFYYRDSLTGTAMYHDFPLMNLLIDEVSYVELSEVEKLFKAELKAAAPSSGNSDSSGKTSETPLASTS